MIEEKIRRRNALMSHFEERTKANLNYILSLIDKKIEELSNSDEIAIWTDEKNAIQNKLKHKKHEVLYAWNCLDYLELQDRMRIYDEYEKHIYNITKKALSKF